MQETRVWSLGQEDSLEQEMASHSRIPSWKIPWTEEPHGLQSMGSQRIGYDQATEHMWTHCTCPMSKELISIYDFSHPLLPSEFCLHLPEAPSLEFFQWGSVNDNISLSFSEHFLILSSLFVMNTGSHHPDSSSEVKDWAAAGSASWQSPAVSPSKE